jgi:hypothetical protein
MVSLEAITGSTVVYGEGVSSLILDCFFGFDEEARKLFLYIRVLHFELPKMLLK